MRMIPVTDPPAAAPVELVEPAEGLLVEVGTVDSPVLVEEGEDDPRQVRSLEGPTTST